MNNLHFKQMAETVVQGMDLKGLDQEQGDQHPGHGAPEQVTGMGQE